MTTSIFNKGSWRAGSIAIVAAVALGGSAFFYWTSRMPTDSPLARMYRTEANLALLVKAVEVYREAQGSYPPSGSDGLKAAAQHLSRNTAYLPEGAPHDGWDRAFRYASHEDYDTLPNIALHLGEDFVNPEGFQLYSLGADGRSGMERAGYREDNITNWGVPDAPWREVYRLLQRDWEAKEGAAAE